MAACSRLLDKRGFTVMETVIAVGLSFLILVSMGGVIVMVQKASKSAADWSNQQTSAAIVGASFTSLVAQARPSLDFIHQPILKSCVDDSSPCLRMLDATQGFIPIDSATSGKISADVVEFYRDHNATLKSGLPITKKDPNAGPASLTYTTPINVTNLGTNAEVYATWPFVDENSPPLAMFVWKSGAKFSIPAYTAKSDADPSANVFLKGESGTVDPATILNQPLVLFNSRDSRQYTVKLVTDVYPCTNGGADATCAAAAGGASYVSTRDVVVKLGSIPSSELSSLFSSATAPPTGGSYDSSASSTDRFPSIATTVVDSESMYFGGASYDPRRILHFYHGSGISGDVVALPVGLVTYRYVRNNLGKLDLVRDLYKGGAAAQRSVILPSAPGNTLFVRKLGTQDFKLISFDSTVGGYKSAVTTLKGSISDRTYTASTLDRRTITYPQDCEMTYTLNSYCGDGDVANYYSTHTDEEYGHSNANYSLVLGYWIAAKDSAADTGVPTPDNWYLMGYDHLGLDTSHVGVQVVNSNRSVSSMQLIKSEVERLASLASNLDDGDTYRLYVSPMLCNDNWITNTPSAEVSTNGTRNAGFLPEGAADTFGGQTCDESALAQAKMLPSAAFSTAPGATPPPSVVPADCSMTCEYAYTPFGDICVPITTCATIPPISTPTPGPSSTPAPTPAPTPTPAPPGTDSPDCTGSVVGVQSLSGAEPLSSSDCWANTTWVPGSSTDIGDPMYGYGGTFYTSGYCQCSNYTPPTPTPTPTPPPAVHCTDILPHYTPLCSGTVSCSESAPHAYIHEDCGYGDSYDQTDYGAPYYVPLFIGF